MTNLLKIMLPLFLFAAMACNNPQSSSSSKMDDPSNSDANQEMTTEKAEELEKEAKMVAKEEVEAEELQPKGAASEKQLKQDNTATLGEETRLKPQLKEKAKAQKNTSTGQVSTPANKPSTSTQTQETPKAAPQEATKKVTETPKEEMKKLDHQDWDALLQKNVSSSGKVNYQGLKNDQAKLDAYLEALKNNTPENSWSSNEKLAYWINAYNAFTVKLIVDNYPLSSITKLHNGKPWDVKWIKMGGKTYSLNNIENDIIRPTFKEPRIHFAVNCAAQSCPPLLNKAWTADNLNKNFEKQTKAFINNSKYNTIGASEIKISKIFDWYGEDFGNIINFVNKYADAKVDANAKVSYKEYDWTLNN